MADWVVGRGQADANRRARPDGLALGAGSWPWHWGMFGRWFCGIKLVPAGGAKAGLGRGAVSFLREVAGPWEQPRGIVGGPVVASPC